ncbi:MAG: polysaccharide biosynthesis protein [Clostridia bacterium]|nr:polysaccharide biosynthesis protein [Clostridia bacterium]
MSEQRKKQSMLNGALILAVSTIIVKVIGALYKIPLTDLIGGVGRGYFNSAYNIYTPIYAISMAGLPVAVARLVSESVSLNRFGEARQIYKVATKLFLITGTVGTAIMFLISYPYVKYVAPANALPSILAIAPSIFFCCAMSSYRGYYEGLRNMTPTAVSQVIEALGKLLIGIGLAYAVLKTGLSQFESTGTVFGKTPVNINEAYSIIYPYTAAAAVMGVTIGTVAGLLYLMIFHKAKGDGITRVDLINSPSECTNREIAKRIITFAVPMVIGSLVTNLTNLIDAVTIQARLDDAFTAAPDIIKSMYEYSINIAGILDEDISNYLYGTYGAALDFRNLIPTITMSLGISALPVLSAAWAVKDTKQIKTNVESVMRVTMLVALPAGFGMAVLAEPILSIMYGNNQPDIVPIAAPIMAVYGFATALMALSTPITSMLQGIGRTDIPVKSAIAGAAVKIFCNYIFVGNPNMNIKGAPIGSILCYVVIVGVNLFYLIRISGIRLNVISVLFKPFFSAGLCAVSAWGTYALCDRFLADKIPHANLVFVALSVAVAVVVYAVSLLLIKGLSKDDVSMLPKGAKIAKTLEKYGFLG